MASTDTEKQPLLDSQSPQSPQDQPSLSALQQKVRDAQREYLKAWSRTTSGKWHRRIIFSVTAFLVLFMLFSMTLIAGEAFDDDYEGGVEGKVKLETYIMSKCPDAKDCLHDLILPVMQRVGRRVDFKLEYIGNVTEDGDVVCKHGEDECLGNLIELCAQKIYPDPRIHLGFTMCLTREYESIPGRTLVDDCALEHGIDMSKLEKCSTDEDGYLSMGLLKESFNRTASAGVSKSCTVRLNGEMRCVRDGGEWKDCLGDIQSRIWYGMSWISRMISTTTSGSCSGYEIMLLCLFLLRKHQSVS